MRKFVPDSETCTNEEGSQQGQTWQQIVQLPVQQIGTGLRKKDEESLISLLLRLARANVFDENGQLKDGKGGVVPGSNVVKLVSYAVRSEARLAGISEFREMLSRLGVDKLPNENLHTDRESFPPSEEIRHVASPRSPPAPPEPRRDQSIRTPSPSHSIADSIASVSRPAHEIPLPDNNDEELQNRPRWISIDDLEEESPSPTPHPLKRRRVAKEKARIILQKMTSKTRGKKRTK